MKKLLSILLSAAISTTLFSGIITANAEAVTYEIGERPYAENGLSSEPIVTTGDGVKFYDDFYVKYNLDNFTDSDFTTKMYLEGLSQAQVVDKNGDVLSTASLEKNSENVYGGTGNSYKLSYEKSNTAATPQGDTIQRSYHRVVAQTRVGTIAYTEAPDLTLAFWVKTEKPVYITVRCFDNNYGSVKSQYLISKEILVPAGESIVEVPFSHMSVERKEGDVSYKKNNGNTDATMNFVFPEILIRPQYKEEGEGARDIYIDNIGYYLVASNGNKTAEHKINAVSKMGDITGYTQVENSTTRVQRTSGSNIYKWSSFDGSSGLSLAPCGTDDKTFNANAYRKAGQSICYSTAKTNKFGSGYYNAFNTDEPFYLSDNYAYFWGNKSTIAIWVKSSRALKIYAEAATSATGSKYKTPVYIVPAGESILRIPVSDFGKEENATLSWRGVYNFTLRFTTVNSKAMDSIGTTLSQATTLYFDALRVECPRIGDSSEDGRISLVDLVKLKKFIANDDATADITLYDVGSDNFDDNGRSLSDGVVDGLDLSILRQFLLGTAKVSVAPFVNEAVAVSTLSSWGYD